MLTRHVYAVQPYRVGLKKNRSGSLAIVIPAEITREFHIDRSTIFLIHGDEKTMSLKIHTVKDSESTTTPAKQRILSSMQQTLSRTP